MIHGFEPEVPQVQCHIDLDKDKSGIVLVRRLLEHTVCQDGEKERQLWQQRVEASLALVSCPIFSKARAERGRCQMHLHPISMLLDATVPMLEAEVPCQMHVVSEESATCWSQVEKHEISNSDEAKELLPRLGFSPPASPLRIHDAAEVHSGAHATTACFPDEASFGAVHDSRRFFYP